VGSVFSFTLPFRFLEKQEPRFAFEAKRARITLASETLFDNLKKRLEQLGLSVLPNISDERPDVIFYDKLESLESFGDTIPTVFLSWNRPGGFFGHFLRKPIRTSGLIETLNRIFNASSPSDVPDNRPPKEPPSSPRYYAKILIVDDNVANRKILQRFLQVVGCTTTLIYHASNGAECIDFLEQQMVDIVFMDIEMPVLGGINTTREIRKRWPLCGHHPYVIGCSASPSKECQRGCLNAGMNGFLAKPIRYESLVKVIQRAIKHSEL
jgi:CheY-like chemotaxis protein